MTGLKFAALSLHPDDPRRNAVPDAFAFAGGGALADKLLALVLAGTKQATTAPRRFVWNPTLTMTADRPVHMPAGQSEEVV